MNGSKAIIAHEYFHNWTGNRITCRDWFQLCLKEGLTVFRDQQFSGDMRSHAVGRIENVLRTPRAPVPRRRRPAGSPRAAQKNTSKSTTSTPPLIYEKGAELIGMLRTLVGDDGLSQSPRSLFRTPRQPSLHDRGLASKCLRTQPGTDLSQFKLWYSASRARRISVIRTFENGDLHADFTQSNPALGNHTKSCGRK